MPNTSIASIIGFDDLARVPFVCRHCQQVRQGTRIQVVCSDRECRKKEMKRRSMKASKRQKVRDL